MAKAKQVFVCTSCGQVYSKWQGRCDGCREWNTIEEQVVDTSKKNNGRSVKSSFVSKRLIDVKGSASERIVTNIGEFNRVMGGGIVKDS
ncbi:MAG: DNA repair protein RadA, partial [Candidatus Cellulosilyticum pullistercoris]|nr:DNA repair protein RadA [Candidatus Cellulosilyticum pullistercoris]